MNVMKGVKGLTWKSGHIFIFVMFLAFLLGDYNHSAERQGRLFLKN